jgi:hypothetical protein
MSRGSKFQGDAERAIDYRLVEKGGNHQVVARRTFKGPPMHHDVERRITRRHQRVGIGIISLAQNNHVRCTVCDVSTAGIGLVLPPRVSILGAEFELTFDETTFHCVTVWRRSNRIGVKIRSNASPS